MQKESENKTNIAITRQDMSLLKLSQLPMSSFGLLAVSFAQQVLDRAQTNTAVSPMFSLDYLEEDGEAQQPKVEISPVLNLDLQFLLQQMQKMEDARRQTTVKAREQEPILQKITHATQNITQQSIHNIYQIQNHTTEQLALERSENNITQTIREHTENNNTQTIREHTENNNTQTVREHTENNNTQTVQKYTENNNTQTVREHTENNNTQAVREHTENNNTQTIREHTENNNTQTVQKYTENNNTQTVQKYTENNNTQTVREHTENNTTQTVRGSETSQPDKGTERIGKQSTAKKTVAGKAAETPDENDTRLALQEIVQEEAKADAANHFKENQSDHMQYRGSDVAVIPQEASRNDTALQYHRKNKEAQPDIPDGGETEKDGTDSTAETGTGDGAALVRQGDVYRLQAMTDEASTAYHLRRIVEKTASMQQQRQQRINRAGTGMRLLGSEAASAMTQTVGAQQNSMTLFPPKAGEQELFFAQETQESESVAQQQRQIAQILHQVKSEMQDLTGETDPAKSDFAAPAENADRKKTAKKEQQDTALKAEDTQTAQSELSKNGAQRKEKELRTVYLPEKKSKESRIPVGARKLGNAERSENMTIPQLEMLFSNVLQAEQSMGLTYGKTGVGVPRAPQERTEFLKKTTKNIMRREQLADAVAAIPAGVLPTEELEFLMTITERAGASEQLIHAAERVVYRTLQLTDRAWAIPEYARPAKQIQDEPSVKQTALHREMLASAEKQSASQAADAAMDMLPMEQVFPEHTATQPKAETVGQIGASTITMQQAMQTAETVNGQSGLTERLASEPLPMEYLETEDANKEAENRSDIMVKGVASTQAILPKNNAADQRKTALAETGMGSEDRPAAKTAGSDAQSMQSVAALPQLQTERSGASGTEVPVDQIGKTIHMTQPEAGESAGEYVTRIQRESGEMIYLTQPEAGESAAEYVTRLQREGGRSVRSAEQEKKETADAAHEKAAMLPDQRAAQRSRTEQKNFFERLIQMIQGKDDLDTVTKETEIRRETAETPGALREAIPVMAEKQSPSSAAAETEKEMLLMRRDTAEQAAQQQESTGRMPLDSDGITVQQAAQAAEETEQSRLAERLEQEPLQMEYLGAVGRDGKASKIAPTNTMKTELVLPNNGTAATDKSNAAHAEAETASEKKSLAQVVRSDAQLTKSLAYLLQLQTQQTDAPGFVTYMDRSGEMIYLTQPESGESAAAYVTRLQRESGKIIRVAEPGETESAKEYLTRLQKESGEMIYLTQPESGESAAEYVTRLQKESGKIIRVAEPKETESAKEYLTRIQKESGEMIYLTQPESGESAAEYVTRLQKESGKIIRVAEPRETESAKEYLTRLQKESGEMIYLTQPESGESAAAYVTRLQKESGKIIRVAEPGETESAKEYLTRLQKESGEMIYLTQPESGESAATYVTRLQKESGKTIYLTRRGQTEVLRNTAIQKDSGGKVESIPTPAMQQPAQIEYFTEAADRAEHPEQVFRANPFTARHIEKNETAAPQETAQTAKLKQSRQPDSVSQPIEMSYVLQGSAETQPERQETDPKQTESRKPERKFLKDQAKESSYYNSLPEWTKDFLENGYQGSQNNAQSTEEPPRENNAIPAKNMISWQNPGAEKLRSTMQPPQEIVLKQPEEKEPAEVHISNSEIRRTADQVYKIIEERLRNERRRRGM